MRIATGAEALAEIAARRPGREAEQRNPHEEVELVRRAWLGALRVPREDGGEGVDGPALFAFLIDLAEADADVAHALRAHYAFVETQLVAAAGGERARWLGLAAGGAIFGNAITEVGPHAADGLSFETKVRRNGAGLRLSGRKFFSTGSLFADWIWVLAANEEGETVQVVLPVDREGIELLDDWDGIGQRFTGSGTTLFDQVAVAPEELSVVHRPGVERPRSHIDTFFQLYLWAVVAGILRVAAADAAELLRSRRRSFAHATTPLPADDPLLQQSVGEIAAAAFAVEATVLRAAALLDEVVASHRDGRGDPDVIHRFQVAVAAVQVHGTPVALAAADRVFAAGGASATRRSAALDRHWRNVRTIASHNPAVYKAARLGDHLTNGALLPSGAYW
jgi:alkylation response protein AidB-like acyl-CoA dehydrogenase